MKPNQEGRHRCWERRMSVCPPACPSACVLQVAARAQARACLSVRRSVAIGCPRAGRRRVVLSTPIAESSLTIEGVRVVVDAGLARRPVVDTRTGMNVLHLGRISKASADQRAGRAGTQ
jgi:Helicase conserved C-terminal domain